jgi:hypothetical protein
MPARELSAASSVEQLIQGEHVALRIDMSGRFDVRARARV